MIAVPNPKRTRKTKRNPAKCSSSRSNPAKCNPGQCNPAGCPFPTLAAAKKATSAEMGADAVSKVFYVQLAEGGWVRSLSAPGWATKVKGNVYKESAGAKAETKPAKKNPKKVVTQPVRKAPRMKRARTNPDTGRALAARPAPLKRPARAPKALPPAPELPALPPPASLAPAKPQKLSKRAMDKVSSMFSSLRDKAAEKFPAIGGTALIADPSVHDSPRHFAMAGLSKKGPEVRVAPELAGQPVNVQRGILAHEIGHCLVLIGVFPLQGKGYDAIERQADKVAEEVFGQKMFYTKNPVVVQCMGRGARGLRPRPKGLR